MNARRKLIRHVATSFDGTVVAVAEFTRHVQIWDIRSHKRLSAFETILDSGGNRLAVYRDGARCFTGAYNVRGVASYDTQTGRELWRRTDLNHVQDIRVSLDGKRLLCGFEDRPFEILDSANGGSMGSREGVSKIWESPYDDVLVLVRRNRDFIVTAADDTRIATLPRQTFTALDSAFAPQRICISESTGPVTYFDLTTGQRVWQFTPGKGIHALYVSYNNETGSFTALTWPYKKGGELLLQTLCPETGEVTFVVPVAGSRTCAFCCKGTKLLAADGNLRDVETGEIIKTYKFFSPN